MKSKYEKIMDILKDELSKSFIKDFSFKFSDEKLTLDITYGEPTQYYDTAEQVSTESNPSDITVIPSRNLNDTSLTGSEKEELYKRLMNVEGFKYDPQGYIYNSQGYIISTGNEDLDKELKKLGLLYPKSLHSSYNEAKIYGGQNK